MSDFFFVIRFSMPMSFKSILISIHSMYYIPINMLIYDMYTYYNMSHMIWIITYIHYKIMSIDLEIDYLYFLDSHIKNTRNNWKILHNITWIKSLTLDNLNKPWLLTADLNKINLTLTSSILAVKPQDTYTQWAKNGKIVQ